MKKRKTIPGTFQVGVTLRTKAEAIELSLAENVQRQDMHPADCVRAFTALRDEGRLSAAEIALRFGYSEGYVGKLLRLGCLAPMLLDEFADGQMSLETAQALVLTDEHDRQTEAFNRCGNCAHSIRRYLTQEKMTTRSAAFLFIGRDAYEAAGGTITVDLFSEGDDGYAISPRLSTSWR